MSDDYLNQRRMQEDIGFKTATFTAGMAHYFSLAFFINIVSHLNTAGYRLAMDAGEGFTALQLLFLENKKNFTALIILAVVNIIIMVSLCLYARYVYGMKKWYKFLWKVIQHELFAFGLCMFLDLVV